MFMKKEESMAISQTAATNALKQYGSMRQASAGLGVSFRTLKKALNGGGTPIVVKEDSAPSKRRTISEKDLLIESDPETKVTAAIRSELRRLGKAEYIRDIDLRRECHANDTGLWREVRVQEEFWPYVMVVGNSAEPMIYWGHPASISSLIERGKARQPNWVEKDGK
jgi:hypothetical protein